MNPCELMLCVPCSAPDTVFDCQFTENKPPYSFSCLIALAIDRSPNRRLGVSDIYAWIEDNFPYFKTHENQRWKVMFVDVTIGGFI